MANRRDQRGEERVPAALTVKVDHATGVTRDISVSGICFETDADYTAGNEISFMVELESPIGKMILKCQGRIVRTEARGDKTGVAVKITESVMEAVG